MNVFIIINNIVTRFPIPGTGITGGETDGQDDLGYGDYLLFEFIKLEDRLNASISDSSSTINNTSDVPYINPVYSNINSIGRSWIFEYSLAKAKEVLGYVRGKYSNIPIPGAEVSLNQQDLLSSSADEKEKLINRLREYFEQTSRQALLERRSAESIARVNEISQVPMPIYVA